MLSSFKQWLAGIFPVQNLIVEVTGRCNLRCPYCYRPESSGNEEFLSPNHFQVILKKLQEVFPAIRLAISGGEPLLHPQLEKLVELSVAADSKCSLLTNLSLFTGSKAKALRARGLKHLQFTFFSTHPAEHDQLREPGDYTRTIKGIVTAKETGFALTAILLVTPLNLANLIPTMTLLAGMGTKSFMVNRFNAGFQNGSGSERLFLGKSHLVEFLANLETVASSWKSTISLGIPIPPCTLGKSIRAFPHLQFSPCPIGTGKGEYFTISPNGEVRVCNHHPRPIGNLVSQEWSDLMKSPTYQEILQSIRTPPGFCSSCSAWESCQGGCRAAAETWENNLKEVDPWVRFVGGEPL